MGRRPRNDLANLARTAREHLKRAEALGRSLDVRLKAKQLAADDFIPDEDWRRDFAAVTTVIQHSGNSLVRALEGNKKNLSNMSNDQLDAQWNVEVVRSAQTMSDEQWETMCKAREKAGK